MNLIPSKQVSVAIDVSEDQFAIHTLPDERFFEVATDYESLEKLADELIKLAPVTIL